MTCCTRSMVACATPQRPLTTFDTVATETPAVRATSDIFTRCGISTQQMIERLQPGSRKRYRHRLTADLRAVKSTSGLYKNPVTLNWWHNANQDGPLKTYWQKVADDFHALHPTVTIKISAVETNDLQRNKIPAALLSGNPPDIFESWGGGEIADQVKAGYLKDITDDTKAEVASMGPASKIWTVDGKQYGLPWDFGIEGFWYNKDLFTQAGISSPPTTLDDLNADVAKLKAATITPVAVGAGDKWPAGHWWYNFAVRECSATALSNASTKQDFTDPCFVKAGQDLQTFLATKPFQADFLATP